MRTKAKGKTVVQNKLEYEIKEIYFRDIQEAEINAQEMSTVLKDWIRKTELTSAPLLCENENGKYICISGHHRIRAALKAGINKGVCIILKKY